MAERFAGRIHVLQSKVCILLQNMPTDIPYINIRRIFLLFYLFIYLRFMIYFCYYLIIPPTLQIFPTVVLQYLLHNINRDFIYKKQQKINFSTNVKMFQNEFFLNYLFICLFMYLN
jgi:hypothetical protein